MKIYLLTLFLLATGCNGFEQAGTTPFGGNENDKSVYANYQLEIQTGPYAGQLVVDQIQNSMIKILIPVGLNSSIPVSSFSSDQWSVSGTVTQDSQGYKTVQIFVPVSYAAQGVNASTVSSLPTGDALSFFPSGGAQHFSFALGNSTNVNLHFYFNPPHMGVFIQTPFDPGTSPQYPLAAPNSYNQTGFFTTYAAKSSQNGGPLLFISLP
jgi:hypothetical protein